MPSAMGAEGVEQPTHTGAGGGFLEAGRGHSWQRRLCKGLVVGTVTQDSGASIASGDMGRRSEGVTRAPVVKGSVCQIGDSALSLESCGQGGHSLPLLPGDTHVGLERVWFSRILCHVARGQPR